MQKKYEEAPFPTPNRGENFKTLKNNPQKLSKKSAYIKQEIQKQEKKQNFL